VRRWRRSGLTAREFAARAGLNAGTLMYWASRLKKAATTPTRAASSEREPIRLPLVELTATVRAEYFELELSPGRRLRIPMGFDAAALERLLAVLDRPGR
jgi:transposase